MKKFAKTIIIDKNAPENFLDLLKTYNINIIKTRKVDGIQTSIATHPDMQIIKINGKFICEESVYEYYCNYIDNSILIKGSRLDNLYPNDVKFNVASEKNWAIHNFKYTDSIILSEIDNNNIIRIKTKQGYSKCSTLILNDNAIITSDVGIYQAFPKSKLLISPGQINLTDYNYGFIGGVGGVIGTNLLAICGDITKHSDYQKIKSFCLSNMVDIIYSDGMLKDIGSIVIVE